MSDKHKPVDAGTYTQDYFTTECEGYDVFLKSGGRELPQRIRAATCLVGDISSLRILDIGCGRGELVHYCRDKGAFVVGLDYSVNALSLAQRILPVEQPLLCADVQHLPLHDTFFDIVFALDLVEHLFPTELDCLLAEVYRVLVPGGRLIIHTMPNSWYYRYGYPVFRFVQRIRGRNLPHDPRDRWRYVHQVHVNEQSPASLRHSLLQAGYQTRVTLNNQQAFSSESSRIVRCIMRILAGTYPFKLVFCNDLFGIAVKPKNL